MSHDPLDERLAALPRSETPPRDLWPAIEAELDRQDRPGFAPLRSSWAPALALAAAAALVVGLSSLRPEPTAPAEAPTWAAQMRGASAQLEDAVRDRRDLDPSVRAEIDRNLAIIDAAIADCEAALADHPQDPQVSAALARAWHQRIDLLADTRDLEPQELP